MKKVLVLLLVLALLAFGGYSAYNYLYQDLSGMTSVEIESFKQENPYVNVSFSIVIEGESNNIVVDQDTTEICLEDETQFNNLTALADYLQHVGTIDLGGISLTVDTLKDLEALYPNCEIRYHNITILNTAYSVDTESLDLSEITSEEVDTVIAALPYLENITEINLVKEDGSSNLSIDDAVKFNTLYPDAKLHFAFDLFGQHVTTDMERLEYFRVNIGDAGLEQIRKIVPMMYNLNYLKLDWCGNTDETMAALREEYSELGIKVVWRVFWDGDEYNALTDTIKLWGNYSINTADTEPLKYFNEIRYLDFGHCYFDNLDFLKYMPDLEVAIVAIGTLKDIEGIRNCTKLNYLEIFSNKDLTNEDMQALAGLTNLEYLNISNIPNLTDLSFTDNMTKLKKVNSLMNRIPQEEVERFKSLHPDCDSTFLSYGDPTNFGWRYVYVNGQKQMSDRYALLTKQIGYDHWDMSFWPNGYVTEPVDSLD